MHLYKQLEIMLTNFMVFMALIRITTSYLKCDCKNTICKTPVGCPRGQVMDACYCCSVCAKDEDEVCGGSNYLQGECGDGLDCVVRDVRSYRNRFTDSTIGLIGRCEERKLLS